MDGEAQSGDLVRALGAFRNWEPVEGILHLNHVPALGYAQVLVYSEGGDIYFVEPESVEVITRGVVTPEVLDAGVPTNEDPGWKSLSSLGAAMRDGLITPSPEHIGGSWEEMEAVLDDVGAPLRQAGWRRVSRDRDLSLRYGDSVLDSYDLGRWSICLALYEDDSMLIYLPQDQDASDDDEQERAGVDHYDQAATVFGELGLLRSGSWLPSSGDAGGEVSTPGPH